MLSLNTAILILCIAVFMALYFIFRKKKWVQPSLAFPKKWRNILQEKVAFYQNLDTERKKRFEFKVQEFLLNHKITGVKLKPSLEDRLLIASSAVIPILEFPEWKYTNLKELILYPDSFNMDFQFDSSHKDRKILGMVGTGYMEGKMILSIKALRKGFSNESDKRNTAVHEFVHLVDKMDGRIDGIPAVLMQRQYLLPWLDLFARKIDEIHKGDSDINPYGGSSNIEFFAVAAEYFFERPQLLKKKHPELYKALCSIFNPIIE